jgi:hypothetical protein
VSTTVNWKRTEQKRKEKKRKEKKRKEKDFVSRKEGGLGGNYVPP